MFFSNLQYNIERFFCLKIIHESRGFLTEILDLPQIRAVFRNFYPDNLINTPDYQSKKSKKCSVL